jgi:hypothetical protein
MGIGRFTKQARSGQHRRHRWLLIAAVVLAWAGLVAGLTAPGETDVRAAGAEVPDGGRPEITVSDLSKGAPAGAETLPVQPARGTEQQPATGPVIDGLAANGIPNVALNAYRVAATRMNTTKPGCGIDWSLLAAIGRVESNHGRFAGATLNPDGTSSPEIRGPALDGGQFAYIGDSDGGRFDHDTRYDRAVGAMQFIPTTWRAYAVDGDGNGTTDPFDIDDAALGAANYLCTAGGDLRTDPGQRRAVLAYNHSDSYVAQVLALARAYAGGIPVDSLPLVGDTSSPVPPPDRSYRGPAAPGPALGSRDTTPASGETVGVREGGGQGAPPAGGAPADQPVSSGGGTAQPAPAPSGGSGGGSSGNGGTTSQGSPAAPAPAAPAPAPAPAPSNPLPLPLPVPSNPLPPAPPLPPPPPVVTELIPGVTCSLTNLLGIPLLPNLPICPK